MKHNPRNAIFASFCLLALAGMACSFSLFQVPTIPAISTQLPPAIMPTATPLPKAQTVFTASLPQPLQAGESMAIAVLDEVTGLAFNPELYPMKSVDATTFTATLALPYNAIVRYHYVRMSNVQAAEATASTRPSAIACTSWRDRPRFVIWSAAGATEPIPSQRAVLPDASSMQPRAQPSPM